MSELVAFASTYADQTVAVDPFSYLTHRYTVISPTELLVAEVGHAIAFISLALPLIDRGIITFIKFRNENICSDCFSKAITALVRKGEANDLYFMILQAYSRSILITYRRDELNHIYELTGPEEVIEHQALVIRTETKCRGARYSVGPLSADVAIKTGLFHEFAKFTENDIIQKAYVSSDFDISNVFASDTELGVLRSAFGKEFIETNFSADVPFLMSRNASKILEIRDGEWHHFEEFRNAFSRASLVARGTDTAQQEEAMQELKSELIKIEKTFRRFNREANRKLADGLSTGLLSLGASMMTSGLSSFLSAAAIAIGSGHFARSTMPALRKKFDEPEEIRDSRMYFAWKVRNALKS